MEEIYDNIENVCNISVVKDRVPSSSKKRLYVGVIVSLGILSVGLLIGLIRLGFLSHRLSISAADLSDMKDNLTKERDQLNVKLLERSDEVTRLQSLLKKKKTCPAGWSMFRCSCYFLSATSANWSVARTDCMNRGGDLVVIDDEDEQKSLFTLTEKSTWIGLTDEETEGYWKWVDGTALSPQLSKLWAKGQPDNADSGEACAQSWNNHKSWNDNNCNASFPWICEKDPM
ncbi:C-type lectin domain family 4 member E-like [Poeciliopsis prolifica]|uniref:C-type lectin domain family 4 member E-like n=1 Tax=Poeciliopsis prolifica TaxID=188132 RepID=UPI002413235F|nr:C-type lectin domain family 4 member E-like [Poeciliopsis prolifica]